MQIREVAQHGSVSRDLPIFVMAPVLPGESMALNIFEPRYRLMVRRCMQGDRRMGMTCAVVVRFYSFFFSSHARHTGMTAWSSVSDCPTTSVFMGVCLARH